MVEKQVKNSDAQKLILKSANELAKANDADILLYNDKILRSRCTRLLDMCENRKRRKNVILFLTTSGGDGNVAYRIARCLQEKYEKFTIIVPGYCKSAGTIIAIGANEIVLFDNGELGPLDVQMADTDDLVGQDSGLNIQVALDKLHTTTSEKFWNLTEFLVEKSEGRLSTKTALSAAKELISNLYLDIYKQINPMKIGAVERALHIATEYGKRLNEHSKNLMDEKETLEILCSTYPDHGFVIDRKEASKLFKKVRPPSPLENTMANILGGIARFPLQDGKEKIIMFLSEEPTDIKKHRKGKTNVKHSVRNSRTNSGNGQKPTTPVREAQTSKN